MRHLLLMAGLLGLAACAPRQTLLEVRQNPHYKRAQAAHSQFLGVRFPKAKKSLGQLSAILRQKSGHLKDATHHYKALFEQGKGRLAGSLARCKMGDLYAEMTAFLQKIPAPNRHKVRKAVIQQIRKVLYKRGIAGRLHYRVLRMKRMRKVIQRLIESVLDKYHKQVHLRIVQYEKATRRFYRRCVEKGRSFGALELHLDRARHYLKVMGT